jgi:chromosome segregation ATPase
MKNEYEDYRKDKAAIDQLKKEIHAKEKERNIAQQQFNNLKISLTNFENIEAVISDIMKAKEKLEKAQEERRKIKSKIDDVLRSYPNIKDYRGQQSSGFDEKVLTDKMESIKTTITALRKKIASTDDQIQTFQTQKEEIERKRGAQQKDSFDIGNKVQELDSLKKRKTELDETVNKLTEETEILRTRIEGLEEKRVRKFLV